MCHSIQTPFLTWHYIQCPWHGSAYKHSSWHDIAYNVLDMAAHTNTVLDMTLHTDSVLDMTLQTMFLTWQYVQCSWHDIACWQCSWHDIASNVPDMTIYNVLDMALHTECLWHDSAYRQDRVAACRWSCGRSPRTGSSPRWPSGGSTSTATRAGSATWSGTPQRRTSFCLPDMTTRWPPYSTRYSSLVTITSGFLAGSCVMALTTISVFVPGFRLCC